MPSSFDLTPGVVFAGDFRIVRPLSEGGMGAVYVAEQISTGKQRALKLMLPQLVADPKLRQRFEQEARVGARIESEHVVEVVGAGVDLATGAPWLAMELLRGENLSSRVARGGPLPSPQVLQLLRELCHAVGAAHAAGIVHRDLKPENIFLAETKRANAQAVLKVLDFGIAKIVAEAKTTLTAAIGSPLWMAPEQTRRGGVVGPTTDVWAIGLIAFYLLTGRSYWLSADEGSTMEMLLREVVLDPMPPASARATELGRPGLLPTGFDAWFTRATDRDPAARWATASEAFAAIATPLAAPSVQPPPVSPTFAQGPPAPTFQTTAAPPPPSPYWAPHTAGTPAHIPTAFQAPIGVSTTAPVGVASRLDFAPAGASSRDNRRSSMVAILVVAALCAIGLLSVIGFVVVPKILDARAAKNEASDAGGADPDEASPIAVSSKDPQWGARDAPVTIVMWADFQCPFSGRVQSTLEQVKTAYGRDKVRVVWKNEPLPFHKNAKPAAEAAQGVFALAGNEAFWKFHDTAFKNQGELDADNFVKWAQDAGVKDVAAYRAGLDSHKWADKVDADLNAGKTVGVNGTPAFFVNGVFINGAQPFDNFKKTIDDEVAKAQAKIAAGTPKRRVYVEMTTENRRNAAKDAGDAKEAEDTTTVYRIPVGRSPALGSPEALVTIVEFADFQCPFCARAEPTLKALREKYGEKLRIVWKNEPLPFHMSAEPAAEAALEVRAEKGDRGFWDVHDRFFANQKDLVANEAPDIDAIVRIAMEAGASGDKVRRAIATGAYAQAIEVDRDAADDFQAAGTPHFFINGRRLAGAQPQEKFETIIDEEVKKAQALVWVGTRPADVYEALVKEGKGAPPPEMKDLPASLPGNDPAWGNMSGKLAVHEWSDFQCPFCGRVEPTLAQIKRDYPEKIKFVWHDLPLPMHADAPLAAQAARETFAQKGPAAFWTFHDKLFENQQKIKRDDLDAQALALGLNMERWKHALDGGAHAAEIEADKTAATAAGISGTPAFIVVPAGARRGYFINGAQTYRVFRRVIERALAEPR
jgi:protein-disulfide isomerase/serine/threonine protein kinase